MNQVEKIRKLLPELPFRDVLYGQNMLNLRRFDELQELVDSSIIRVKNALSSGKNWEKYKDINVDNLEELSSLISAYRDALNGEVTRDEYIEDVTLYGGDIYSMDDDY